jgi:hypothetical protein
MSVSSALFGLQEAHKVLMHHWEIARDQWQDSVALRFGEQTIEPIEREVRKATTAMSQLAEAVDAARRECS